MQTRFNHLMLKAGFAAAAIAVGAALQPVSLRADERDDRDVDRDDDRRDPVVLSFSTVGDSRQDPATPDPTTLPLSGQDAHWLQNTKVLTRISRSIEHQQSSLLFFNGDMIMGYGHAIVPTNTATVADIVNSDLAKFYTQYAFWRGMVAGMMEAGTYVVPVPGNHEVQSKPLGKKAQVANENAWRANLGDLILDNSRFLNLFGEQPTNSNVLNNGPVDALSSDQTQLSFSFDFHGSHFVVINTDPVGQDAHAPVNWLASDLQAAQARGFKRSFVFGHKPAFTYYFGTTNTLPATPSGLDNDPASRDAFWSVIEQYGAAYFCGHEHIFNITQPTATTGGKAWQVLVGSGGSPFDAAPTDATLSVTDRYYAWATVKIYQSGKVKITAYGFDDHFGPTRVLQTVVLN
jgi:hypothetical protein